jgi:hypothetical protein
MKKEEIIAMLKIILNDSDNDYEIDVKKSGNIIKTSFRYKIIICKQYYVNEIKKLNDLITKLPYTDNNKKKYELEIDDLKNNLNFIENNFFENEYLFDNKSELESFIKQILNKNNKYCHFSYDNCEIYFMNSINSISVAHLIAKIELV